MLSLRDQVRLRPIEQQTSEEPLENSVPCQLARSLPGSLRAAGPVINVTGWYKRQTESLDSVDRLLEDLEAFHAHLADETFKNTSLYNQLELGYRKAVEQGQKVHDGAFAEIEAIQRSKRLIRLYLSDADQVSDLESSTKVELLSQKCKKLQTWLDVGQGSLK